MGKYNTTDLDPMSTFERHVFHRDQFAHYLRWTHILKNARIGENIVDFGCGKGNLLEVFYRNKFKCQSYIGIDIRKQTINKNIEKFSNITWAKFIVTDLVLPQIPLNFEADKVCSFEVLEHIGKSNADKFLHNMVLCGKKDATFYISTPVYNENVGAAGNHIYDCGDGKGEIPQEFTYSEVLELFKKYFNIENSFGTFASMRDYKPHMNEWQKEMFTFLSSYYDSNLLSNIMAPMFPEYSRNILWVLKRK